MHHTHKTLAAMACTCCQYYNNEDDLLIIWEGSIEYHGSGDLDDLH